MRACSTGSACSSASREPSYVLRALGRLSVETLLGELEGLEVPQRRLIEPELVVRASTAAPRQAP